MRETAPFTRDAARASARSRCCQLLQRMLDCRPHERESLT